MLLSNTAPIQLLKSEAELRKYWQDQIALSSRNNGECLSWARCIAATADDLERYVKDYAEYEKYAKERLLIHVPLEHYQERLLGVKILCEELERYEKSHARTK